MQTGDHLRCNFDRRPPRLFGARHNLFFFTIDPPDQVFGRTDLTDRPAVGRDPG